MALLESSGGPIVVLGAHIASGLGIQPSMLWNWRRRFGGPGGRCAPPTGRRRHPMTTLGGCDEQEKELARLKCEVDHL
jgi:hypothetical protein